MSTLPEDFRVERTYDGPQLLLTWTPPDPGVVSRYRILRRKYDYPQKADDGVIVVDTDDVPFATDHFADLSNDYYAARGIPDKGIESGVTYYYAFFSLIMATGTWVTDVFARGKGIALPTTYFENKLWDLLPTLYHTADGGEG